MSNRTLIFKSDVLLEAYTDNGPAGLMIELNGEKVFSKQFLEKNTHKEHVEFEAQHADGALNKLTFTFSGPPLTANKYFQIKGIAINKQSLNVLNAEYFPEIDQSWWEGLTAEQKINYDDIIHGKTGNKFGWWGQVNFYYCSGFDFKSKMRYNHYGNRSMLHEQVDWIYLDEHSIKDYKKIG